jgi:hypothetical protein
VEQYLQSLNKDLTVTGFISTALAPLSVPIPKRMAASLPGKQPFFF